MHKKKIFLFFALCIGYSAAFSEKAAISFRPDDSTSIFYKSLKLHLEYIEKNLGYQSLPVSGYWNINMEIPDQVTGQLPDRVGHFRINYLGKKEIRASIKKYRSIDLIRMNPVIVEDNMRIVGIVDFIMTLRKRKLNYGNSGGTTVKFRYDDSKDSFVLVDLKQGSL